MGHGRVQARATPSRALGRAILVALTLLLLVPLAATATGSPAAATGSPGRPNVVMLMIDDLTLEQYQHWMPKTRARLEPTGTTYDDSVVSFSECCPSRATLFTGQYAHNHGVLSGNLPTGGYTKLDHTNTLPVWLHDAGYYTAQIGKYMNGYGADAPPDIPPGWDNWFTLVDPSTQFFWDYTANDNGTLRHYGTTAGDYRETVETNRALQTIDQVAGKDQPFFLDFNPSAPHVGFPNAASYAGQGLEQLSPSATTGGIGYYPPASTDGSLSGYAVPHTPDFNEADVSDKPAFRQLAPLTTSQVATVDNWYRKSSELVKALDDNIAAIIDELQVKGVLDNTVIMFTSDNGVFFGEHRIATGKEEPYEPSVRVPLVVRGPGFGAGVVEHRPVVNVDLNPTIVSATGATPRLVTDGRPLQALAVDPSVGIDRPILLETGPLWGRRYYRGIRTKRWKYIEYTTGERELFDLVNDPYELRNLADQSSTATDQLALRNLLLGMRACRGATCLAPPPIPTGTAPPFADAGADSQIAPGQTIFLTGLDSFDPDGGLLTYRWSVVQGSVGILSSTQVNAVSQAPWTFGHLVYRLTVTDSSGLSASKDVAVDVGYPYHHPITNAGIDQVVRSGGTATLSATGSAEQTGGALTYQWSQTSGPTATLTSPNSATTAMTAPTGPVTLGFTVFVTDSAGRKGSDALAVNVSAPGVLVPVTITAASASKVFGQAAPSIGYTASGTIDTVPITRPVCSTNATSTSAPGTYATTCTGPASDSTYRYTYVAGVLTEAKAATAVALATSSSTLALGDPVTLTATVSAVAPATGSPGSWLTFYDGAVQLGTAFPTAGKATFTVPSLGGGAHAFSAIYSSGANYGGSGSATTTVSVARRPITVRAADARSVLGATVGPIGWSAQGQLAAFAITAPTCTTSTTAGPGTYATTCSGVSTDANYTYAYVNGALTIDRAPVVITARSASTALGQPVPGVAFDRVGAVTGYPATAPSCSVVAPSMNVVGTYPTRCSGPVSDANYDYTYLDGVLTVARAAVTVRASSPTMHLGDAVPAVGAAIEGAIDGVPPAVPVCSAGPVVGAGTVVTRCSGPVSDANYAYTYVDGTLSVGRAAVTVQAASPSVTLGDAVPAIGFTVAGAVDGFAPRVPTCQSDPVSGAGSVSTRCAGPTSDADYDYTYVDGVLTVGRAAVTVEADSPTMTFGDAVPTVGFVAEHAVAGFPVSAPTCSADPVTGPGRYPTACTGPLSDVNYDYTYLPGTLAVGGAHLTIVASSPSVVAGAELPTVSFTLFGAPVDGFEMATPSCAAIVPIEPTRGVYVTRCTGPASDGVYDYTYVDGALHLGSVTVTAADQTTVIGDPIGAVDFTVAGADPATPIAPPTCTVVGPDEPPVGLSPTRCTGPASDANYDYTYVDGASTVDRAHATVQTSSSTMTFGEAVPTVDFTVVGAVEGFPPAVPTCAADPVVDAGSVATRCAGPASDETYDYTYVDGVLTVAPDVVTVQASDATMTFGDPVPAITYTSVVGHPADGAPVSPPTCSATSPDGAGFEATVCSGTGSDRDHVYHYLPGILTVLPRPVTVTAASATIRLGDPVPMAGYRTDGDLPGTPVAEPSCSTASGTGVGDRPTTCSGGAEDLHYRYTYAPGVLSVTRAPITVVATSPTATFGQPVPAVAGSDLGVVAGFAPAASTCAAVVIATPAPGSYPTTCDGPAADDNYDYHYLPGTLTVTRAPVRVTASSLTVVVGQPVPAITASTTGTVSGTPPAASTCSTVTPKGAGTSLTACTGPSSDASYTYTYVAGLLTVQRAATTTTLSTSVDTAPVGQTVTLRAVETVVAPGQAPFTAAVEFFDGSSLVGAANVVNGQATLSLPSLGIGPHTFTAAYREGSDLQGSTSALVPVTVVKATTAMALSASTTSAAFGQAVTLNATISVVAPGIGSPGSSVVFSDGTASLTVVASAGGRAALTTSTLSVGTHTLTATYLEGAKFTASTSAPVIVTVTRAVTSTVLALSPSAPVRGQPVTMTATVAAVAPAVGVPGASVTFSDGAIVLGTVAPVSGTATFTTTLSAGSHSIIARYAGGANFAPSASTTITLTVP